MSTTTVRAVLDAVQQRVQLAGGPGVQLYGDPSVLQMLNDNHRELFDKYWWPWAMTIGDQYSLTGVDGYIVGDLSAKVLSYGDIQNIWLNTAPAPLPRYNSMMNPALTIRPGIIPDSDPTKVFRLMPTAQTGTVTLSYRTRPADFVADTDVIKMDKLLLVYACAYDYINGLGFNPNEEAKLQGKFADRLQAEIDRVEGKLVPMGIAPYSSDGWQESY